MLESGEVRSSVGRDVEETQYTLVHAKHNGSTGNCPHEMRRHASVKADHAFLLEDDLEALDQSGVLSRRALWWCLTQASACDLFANVSTNARSLSAVDERHN